MLERQTESSGRSEFEHLTLPHLGSLYNTAVWLTRSRQEAQDLVQETLLTAYRFFSRFTPGTNYRAWLFTILRNLHRNFCRKHDRDPLFVPWAEAELNFRPTDPPGWGAALAQSPGVFDLEEALRTLPEQYRFPLLLAEVEGFSYKDVARILEVPMGTVKSRICRAKHILKGLLLEQANRSGSREG